MTVSSTVNKTQANGNGSTSAFPFAFKFTASSEIEVYVDDTLKTLSTHYTLSLPGDSGTVTFLTAPTDFRPQTGEVVTIRRIQPLTQTFDPTAGGGLSSSSVEGSDDNLLMKIQQVSEEVSRAPKLKDTTETGELTFPEPSASDLIAWNAAGTALENVAAADVDITAVTPFIATLLDDASAAEARTTLGLVIGTDVQAHDADLDAIAALTTTAIGRSLLAAADAPAIAEIAGVGVTDSPTFVNLTQTGYTDLTEIAAPSNPSANVARLYAYDESAATRLAYKDNAGNTNKLASTASATVDNAAARFDGTTGLLQSSAAILGDNGALDLPATVTPHTADPVNFGFFSDYEMLTAWRMVLTQAEVQAEDESGGWRSALNIQHYDNDTTDYDSLGYRTISDGIHIDMQGHATGTNYKDLHGITSNVIGNVGGAGGSDRGNAAFAGTVIQYGSGVAVNEARIQNPADADFQSVQMVGWLITMEGRIADNDASHAVRGLEIQNIGKRATAVIEGFSLPSSGDPGTWQYGIKLDEASVTGAAIVMPDSASGDVGTIITYDANDYTYFSRSSNFFDWVIGGTSRLRVSANGIGYAAGGGQVTQLTSKATGVTLNTPTGRIIMHNAALNAGVSVSFTLTNSCIATLDNMIVNQSTDGGTSGAYRVIAKTIGSGTCVIEVTNTTGGNLSESVVVNFSLIKAVNA